MNSRTPLEWKRYFESEEFEQNYYYDESELGFTLRDDETSFRIWAPTAVQANLNLYKSGNSNADDLIETITMQQGEKGTWFAVVPRNLKNIYYTYTIIANGEAHVTQDVYSKACGVNGQRSMVVDLNATNPSGWQEDHYVYDSSCLPAIYELHVKDFSFAESSGIQKEYRGKYKAFTVKDSTLNGKGVKPTCLAYLKELGITHVHILPSYDFGSVDEAVNFDTQFNWGYDPINYNVPEGSYATDPFDGNVRIREFKEMVQALHEAGLGVIMDVVYNHTYSMDSCFQKTVPYYYYRVKEDGALSNGSICGNDTASDRKMYRKYMADSVCYWAKEYHIDGFRFDLMGLHDVETMNQIRRRLNELPDGEHILMYGEPWAGSDTTMREGAVAALKKNVALLDKKIAIFNDDTRDAIKGDVFYAQRPGFVNGTQNLEQEIRSAVLAWCDGAGGYQPHDPGQIITYVSAHDNWSLWDKLNYTMRSEGENKELSKVPEDELRDTIDFKAWDEEILQANKFAAGIVMTCLGSVFMQAGEEAARTKLGIGDSFSSPPTLNALDWERMYQYEELIQYYKGMLKLRKECITYWKRDRTMLDKIRFYDTEEGCVAFSIETENPDSRWERLWIVYAKDTNTNTKTDELHVVRKVKLPAAERILLSDGINVFENLLASATNTEELTVVCGGVTVFGEPWVKEA